jgi:hypothetical protein
VRRVLASIVCALAASAPALAAGPAVPRPEQRQLKAFLVRLGAPDLALVPTSLPAHYAFESFSVTGSPVGLDVSVADQRFIKTPTEARAHEISFDTRYFKGVPARCSSGSRRTVEVGGRSVYCSGQSVWWCLRSSRGHVVRTSAHGRLAVTALAAFVVSARPTG